MSKTDYLEQKWLDDDFGITPYTPPATKYFALSTTATTDAGGITEPVGNAYARVAVTNSGVNFTRTGSQVANSTAIPFAAPSPGNWGTVTHGAIFDAPTGGNMVYHGALVTPLLTAIGTPVTIAIGQFTHSED